MLKKLTKIGNAGDSLAKMAKMSIRERENSRDEIFNDCEQDSEHFEDAESLKTATERSKGSSIVKDKEKDGKTHNPLGVENGPYATDSQTPRRDNVDEVLSNQTSGEQTSHGIESWPNLDDLGGYHFHDTQPFSRWTENEPLAGPSHYSTYYTNQRMNFLIVDSPQRKQTVWTEFVSSDGQLYFFNKLTKETCWEKPDELKTPVEKLLSSEWQEYQFSDGSVYFYNTITNETTWDFPYEVQSVRPDECVLLPEKGNSGEPCSDSLTRKDPPNTPDLTQCLPVLETKEHSDNLKDVLTDRGDGKKE